jgi:hypothetical protein
VQEVTEDVDIVDVAFPCEETTEIDLLSKNRECVFVYLCVRVSLFFLCLSYFMFSCVFF